VGEPQGRIDAGASPIWDMPAYDPAGLFFVHHGVGSEDWNADGINRLR
jgi:hypothetical protein